LAALTSEEEAKSELGREEEGVTMGNFAQWQTRPDSRDMDSIW